MGGFKGEKVRNKCYNYIITSNIKQKVLGNMRGETCRKSGGS